MSLRTRMHLLGAMLIASPAMAMQASPLPPKAYIVAEIEVTDPATYEGYKAAVAPLVHKFGGRYLVRGGNAQSVEGETPKGRVVILEFPTLAMAQSFIQADDYRPVAEVRHKSAKSRIIMVEGLTP